MGVWGVDSASPANSYKSGMTLYNYVKSKAGESPKFWGRYLSGIYAMNEDEIKYIHSNGTSVLPLFNLLTAESVSGTKAEGSIQAQQAISAAQQLGLPNTCCIFGDIETNWNPSVDWICGWADGMRAGPYEKSGGFYCNPLDSSFYEPFLKAQSQSENAQLIYLFASEPEPNSLVNNVNTEMAPATCGNNKPVLWQYGENCFSGSVDLDTCEDSFLQFLYNPQPQTPYNDVPAGQWYTDAVIKVTQLGLMQGYNGQFRPNDPITRAELAQVLDKLTNRLGW